MHTHDNWDGPVRGSSAWWRGMLPPGSTEESAIQPPNQSDPNVRWNLVQRIRKEIAAGVYDSDEKWHAALDRALDELG